MKCQKCAKASMVHLTEVVSEGGMKRTVEIHLCLMHAVEAGLIAAGPEAVASAGSGLSAEPEGKAGKLVKLGEETSIVPAGEKEESGMVVSRERGQADPAVCPNCGLNWGQFKQAGLMGCPHDYELFMVKLMPLLKRAQEGASEHVGKMAARRRTVDASRQVTTLRLRKELQKAVDAENYEQAANLRDQLRKLEQN